MNIQLTKSLVKSFENICYHLSHQARRTAYQIVNKFKSDVFGEESRLFSFVDQIFPYGWIVIDWAISDTSNAWK